MSQAKPITSPAPEMITGDPTYYMVYTGTAQALNDWLKTRKGKDTVLPILETRPVKIWCPNDNNHIFRLERKTNVQGVSPDFPGNS